MSCWKKAKRALMLKKGHGRKGRRYEALMIVKTMIDLYHETTFTSSFVSLCEQVIKEESKMGRDWSNCLTDIRLRAV